MYISFQTNIQDLHQETYMLDNKSIDTPIDPYHRLGEKKEEVMADNGIYQRMVGKTDFLLTYKVTQPMQ